LDLFSVFFFEFDLDSVTEVYPISITVSYALHLLYFMDGKEGIRNLDSLVEKTQEPS